MRELLKKIIGHKKTANHPFFCVMGDENVFSSSMRGASVDFAMTGCIEACWRQVSGKVTAAHFAEYLMLKALDFLKMKKPELTHEDCDRLRNIIYDIQGITWCGYLDADEGTVTFKGTAGYFAEHAVKVEENDLPRETF